ncbi:hypothetical protein B0H13DRAFT_2349584 [Mycena leptocephala]|nr:hypothetical protein B0H13DRAFT_2349584 [Mycena leptocephala]
MTPTVESLRIQRLKEREGVGLADMGIALDMEGNVWWPGSVRAGWEDVIGIILTFTDRTDYAL